MIIRLSGKFKKNLKHDYLLIWIDEATNTIKLLRLGTHHELFGI